MAHQPDDGLHTAPDVVRSAATKAIAAFREGRLPWSPTACTRLFQLHRRELSTPSVAPTPAIARPANPFAAFAVPGLSLEDTLASGEVMRLPQAGSPAVSILLPVFNRADLTLRCLRSLTAIQLPIEIVVIDNASTDRTGALLGRTGRDRRAKHAERRLSGGHQSSGEPRHRRHAASLEQRYRGPAEASKRLWKPFQPRTRPVPSLAGSFIQTGSCRKRAPSCGGMARVRAMVRG